MICAVHECDSDNELYHHLKSHRSGTILTDKYGTYWFCHDCWEFIIGGNGLDNQVVRNVESKLQDDEKRIEEKLL